MNRTRLGLCTLLLLSPIFGDCILFNTVFDDDDDEDRALDTRGDAVDVVAAAPPITPPARES